MLFQCRLRGRQRSSRLARAKSDNGRSLRELTARPLAKRRLAIASLRHIRDVLRGLEREQAPRATGGMEPGLDAVIGRDPERAMPQRAGDLRGSHGAARPGSQTAALLFGGGTAVASWAVCSIVAVVCPRIRAPDGGAGNGGRSVFVTAIDGWALATDSMQRIRLYTI